MIMWQNNPPLQKIGSLQVLDFPQPAAKLTVVMFHGYGADAYDLSSLREEVNGVGPMRWLFPQGPKEVEIGPGVFGRSWFPIDMAAHERAANNGDDLSYADFRPPGINEARDQALSFLKNLNVSLDHLILGGFSQGAMLAADLAMTLPMSVKALILLSATLADQKGVKQKAPLRKGMKYFQSHGQRDQVLPFSMAEALHHELGEAGWEGTFTAFGGGHEIPGPVIRDLNRFLKSLN